MRSSFHSIGFPDWSNPVAAAQYASQMQANMLPPMSGLEDDPDASENLSYNQRNVKKWKKDEPLGDMATISPVLFANMCHPELKTQFAG